MDKSQIEMLQEIRADIDSLKEKLSALEARLADIPAVPDEAEEVDFTDVEIGVSEPAEVEVSSLVAEERADAPADETSTSPNPDGVEVASFVADNRAEAPQDATSTPSVPEVTAEAPVEDDTIGLPWRKDYPGMEVKNIRSGISLNDRALFITTLFKEDFQLYDQTIQDLNQMNSLQEAIDYIRSRFPLWNLKSDVVYHFMMCVRKKLR